ncbi:MAG: SMEK domain-containing protein [Gammaproteobacteria bacterium]|nr:SMEK domain-containing protein [Gammaproteobacteria bacterium]
MNQQILINYFRRELAVLTSEVEMSVKAGHFDINSICEDVFCDLFKVLYGFRSLRNLNIDEKKNFPGIDLADDEAKVAIQVTSDKTIRKIKSTLVKVIQHNLHRKYSKIVFYNLTRKQGSYSQDSINIACQGKIEFNVNTDILDYTDLAARAANADLENLERAVNILLAYTLGGDVVGMIGVQISRQLAPDPHVQQILDGNMEQALSNILSFRVFSHRKTIEDIQTLRQRVSSNNNNLSTISDSLKVKIDYWTARLCAIDEETLDLAKDIRGVLTRAHKAYPDINLAIVDALIAEAVDDNNKALRILRDQDDPDSRATLFSLLARLKGESKALNWFKQQEKQDAPDFFTPIGWFNWAKIMAKLGKWEDASTRLVTLDKHWPKMPALALIEGQINAAMLLPDGFRGMVLEGLPLYTGITPGQGADKETFHTRATECFEYFNQHPVVQDDEQFTKFISNWKLWLRLMIPNRAKLNAARKEIRQLVETGNSIAVDVIDFAHVFNIPYDNKPLKQYLEQRKECGGLADPELNAECLINEQVMTPSDRVIYLEQHQTRLRKIMPVPFLVAMQVAALVEGNQSEKARALVEKHTVEIGEIHSRYLFAIISRREGKDTRQDLEKLYREEKSLPALQSLVSYIKGLGDRSALLPYACDLFERVRNEDNALNVIWCLGDQSSFDHEATLEFIKCNNDIVEQSDDLKEIKAFTLFHVGQYHEAKQVNDTLLNTRGLQADHNIDINIAICSGDWEHIVTIIERAWAQRDISEPEFLMSLATLAGQLDKTPQRALELAELAAKKAHNDPHVLASAYWLHFQLGHENEANPDWLNRAAEHSSDDHGPLRRVDIKEFVTDLIPERQVHLDEIEKKWSSGELPTSVAVNKFNMSLARLIFQVSTQNSLTSDIQRKIVLPLIACARTPVELHDNWIIGLDITSIMVLAKLNLLETALKTFHHVKFSPNVMEMLFQEKGQARFHQPSRIEAAKQVQKLLNRSQLCVAELQSKPSPNITSEVGPELAVLLQLARDARGKVVCVLPIYKAGSLMEQRADTSLHDDLIITIADLCVLLHKEGKIDTNDYDRAMHHFNRMGQTERTNLPPSVLNKTFYIDRSALSYLQDVDMLQLISTAGLDIQVHPDVLEEQYELLEAGDTGEQLINKIEDIRRILRDAVASGSASFLPRSGGLLEQARNNDTQLESIRHLSAGNDAYDALCFDDRFYNKFPALTRPSGKTVPIVCMLDVLRYLLKRKHISVAEHWGFRHILRHGGFTFIPLDPEELIHWLKGSSVDNGQLREGVELRLIRQAHERFNASYLATAAEAQALSQQTQISHGHVIPRLWQDLELSPEQAATGSGWVWRYLLMMSVLNRKHYAADGLSNSVRDTIALYLVRLIGPLTEITVERRAHYTEWLERYVLQPLRAANADIIKMALTLGQEAISKLDHDMQQGYGSLFLEQLPEVERNLLMTSIPDFAERCGFKLDYLLTIGSDIQLEGNALFKAAKDVFATNKEIPLQDETGKLVSVGIAEDRTIFVKWTHNKDEEHFQQVTVPELTLLSPDPETRLAVLDNIIDRLGPTSMDCRDILKDIEFRTANNQELSSIFKEAGNGVTALQSRLVQKISRGLNFNAEDVVPQSIAYFERFVGPAPDAQAPEIYFKKVLIPYRKKLLSRDLAGGLDICCLGTLSDELSPGQWVCEIDNDTLWSALSVCHAKSNPFSLLGALDIALYRQDDPRFRGFAEEAVTQLLDKDFGQQNGTNLYRLLQVTANFILNRVHLLENGHKYPGYWKRIGVWMQTGLVVRTMAESGGTGDIDGFQKWTQECMFLDGFYAEFVNAWKENAPILPGSSQAVRDEIFGRLIALKSRHEKERRQLSGLENLNHILGQYRKEGISSIVSTSENILGHQPLSEPLPQELSQILEKALTDNVKHFLETLVVYSQFYVLGTTELENARESVKKLAGDIEGGDEKEILMCLQLVAIVAATSRDTALADHVLNQLINITPAISKDELLTILLIMLRTSGAFETQHAWFDWLENGLTVIATRLSNSEDDLLQELLPLIEPFDSVFPAETWFHLRASSIASANTYNFT